MKTITDLNGLTHNVTDIVFLRVMGVSAAMLLFNSILLMKQGQLDMSRDFLDAAKICLKEAFE